MRNVARMREVINAYKILAGIHERKSTRGRYGWKQVVCRLDVSQS
jgi:hypothetical protein